MRVGHAGVVNQDANVQALQALADPGKHGLVRGAEVGGDDLHLHAKPVLQQPGLLLKTRLCPRDQHQAQLCDGADIVERKQLCIATADHRRMRKSNDLTKSHSPPRTLLREGLGVGLADAVCRAGHHCPVPISPQFLSLAEKVGVHPAQNGQDESHDLDGEQRRGQQDQVRPCRRLGRLDQVSLSVHFVRTSLGMEPCRWGAEILLAWVGVGLLKIGPDSIGRPHSSERLWQALSMLVHSKDVERLCA